MKLFEIARKNLVRIIQGDESIQRISIASWIVAKTPRRMQRLGFTIGGPVSGAVKQEEFPSETREVATAFMTRAEFLQKYGSE